MAAGKKLLLVGGLAVAAVAVLVLNQKKAKAAPVDDGLPAPQPGDGFEGDDIIPRPDEDDDEVPEEGEVPEGIPSEEVDRGRQPPPAKLPPDKIVVEPEPGDLVRPPGSPPKFFPEPKPEPPAAKLPIPPPPEKLPIPKVPKIPGVPEKLPKLPVPLPGGDLVIPPPDTSTGVDIPNPLPGGVAPPDLKPGEEVELPPPAVKLDGLTENMLRVLLGKEATSKWKVEEPSVRAWQKSQGRPVDGKYGPGDAKHLATLTGLLPIVRFWPRGKIKNKAVPDFQSELLLIADKSSEPIKTQLMAAAQREQGQGFGSKQKPIAQRIEL